MPDFDIYVENAALYRRNDFYALSLIERRLAEMGFDIRVRDGFANSDLARCAIVHLDLTELPDWARSIRKQYPVCINGRAASINRLQYSKLIINREDAFRGPVIAKTILNSRGLPELRYREARNLATRFMARLRRRLIENYEARMCPPYRVFQSPTDIPAKIWNDPRRIVERFVPGKLEPPVAKDRYNFFGPVQFGERLTHNALIGDDTTISESEVLGRMPADVSEVCQNLNVEYGAVDYFAMPDGNWIIDVNKTPMLLQKWIDDVPEIGILLDRMVERFAWLIRTA